MNVVGPEDTKQILRSQIKRPDTTSKRIYPCSNSDCKHDYRKHAPTELDVRSPRPCEVRGCKCQNYIFLGETKVVKK